MKIHWGIFPLFTIYFLTCSFSLWAAENGAVNSGLGIPNQPLSKNEIVKRFADANEKYSQASKLIAAKNNQEAEKDLKEAALQYEVLLLNGFKHGQVYYNLGNTYYRQWELGKAIVNYKRAQRLMPRNADLDANLRLVKNSTEDKEPSDGTPAAVQRIFFWLFFLNQNELIVLTATIYVVLMILFFVRIIFKYEWLKKIIIGFSIGLFILVVSIGIKVYAEHGISRGVIIAPKCQVRYGPGDEYEPKFEIHNGAECIIEGEKDGWYRVYVNVGVKQDAAAKADGEGEASKEIRRGWLHKNSVDMI